MLLQIGDEHIPSPPQAFHMLPVVILALSFPLRDKGAVRGEGVFVKVSDMGDQVAFAIANVKASIIVKFLSINDCFDCKVGLMIPTNLLAFVLSFPVLLFVQNTEQTVSEGKTQIRIAVIQFPVIKSRVFGKTNGKGKAVRLLFGRCLFFLALSHDDFQMVVGRVFPELFLKIRPAHFLAKQRELHITQRNSVLGERHDLILICAEEYPVILMEHIADGVQLRQFLRKPIPVAAAVNTGSLTLHQSKEVDEVLHSGRL